MNSSIMYEIVNQRINDLQRHHWRSRARRVNPDGERQPKRHYHWANR